MTHLAAVILTLNEEEHISDCIQSLAFADSVLVFDSFSTDETIRLAETAGAQVIQNRFENYAQQRNAAMDAVRQRADWLLFVDADERITPELATEIRQAIDSADYAAYRIPRHNYIFGQLTLGAGWYPDYQTRLLRLDACHYDPERVVHEIVVVNGAEGTLKHEIVHYNYKSTRQFTEKQRKYTAYEARILFEQGIRPKAQNYILQPLRHFRWRFFTLKGYRDGLHGLRLSAWMAWYELQKYLILRKLWQQK